MIQKAAVFLFEIVDNVEAESLLLFFFSVEKRWKHISACVGSIFFFFLVPPFSRFYPPSSFPLIFFEGSLQSLVAGVEGEISANYQMMTSENRCYLNFVMKNHLY